MKKDRGLVTSEITDGRRSIEVLIYRPDNTPAKFDGDTICLRFRDLQNPAIPDKSIYLTSDEAICVASGLLQAGIKDGERENVV